MSLETTLNIYVIKCMFNGTNHELNKIFTEFLAASVLLWVRVTPLRLVGTPPPTAE